VTLESAVDSGKLRSQPVAAGESKTMRTTVYRADVDGLRAVAVLAVVLFHAFPGWLTGGFIGVDVFFVISGFLISNVIVSDLGAGSFSIGDFYLRRVKRIFPALIVVLSVCYVFAWYALFPDEYKAFAKHVAAAAGFVSNFVLWSESGYFDTAAETKPLLHLWSLGIEEQFYVLWPLVLWLTGKRYRLSLTLALLVASLVADERMLTRDISGAFYSPHLRAWELLFGSLLAQLGRVQHCQRIKQVLSVGGLTLLAIGLFSFTKETAFPGKWALVPVVGATAIIAAGPDGFVNRTLLSSRVAVFIGLVSYPLYLWHWPLLAFARILESQTPALWIRVVAVLLSIALAYLTFRFVERPLRFGSHGKQKAGLLALLMVMLGVLGFASFRVEERIAAEVSGDDRYLTLLTSQAVRNCMKLFPEWTQLTDAPCLLQNASNTAWALVGDSHAGHLFSGLVQLRASLGEEAGGVAVFGASCSAPFIDTSTGIKTKKGLQLRENAYQLINKAYDHIIHDPKVRVVILAHQPGCSYLDAKNIRDPDNTDYQDALFQGMTRTFAALREAKKGVLILLDNPQLSYDPKRCSLRPFRLTAKGEDFCVFPRAHLDQQVSYKNYRALITRAAQQYPEVRVLDLSERFCDEKQCAIAKDNTLFYQDKSHLTKDGSLYVAEWLIPKIDELFPLR
jgi:peptidoglycan/LPS O-acetylase OafA/YrhL